MNPMDMMQFASRLGTFTQQHPKFIMFLKKVAHDGVSEGDILEINYRSGDGRESKANIKLTNEDIETINLIKNMRQS